MNSRVKSKKSIKEQLMIRFGIIFLILIVAGALFLLTSWNVEKVQEKAILYSNNKMRFQQAVSDHYRWSSQLNSAMCYGHEFDGSLDSTQCNFGKYIYSEEVQNDPHWEPLLAEIEPLHNKIHDGAKMMLSASNADVSRATYFNSVQPALDQLVEVLNREAAELDVQIAASQEAEAKAVQVQIVTIVIQILILFVILILTFRYVGKDVVNPVIAIETASRRLAEGELSMDFSVSCKNSDIQELSVSLNSAVVEIKKYVSDISRAMGEMSRRNLNVNPSQPFIGDFKPIEDSIGRMLYDLTDTLSQFEVTASQVFSSSSQVSDGAQALAQGATQQASSVEELAATVAEVSDRITNNAENTNRAGKIAQETTDAVTASNQQMQELMVSMSEIDARSKEIGNIIKTIEDIAFQTNILALNAAVEAARAGAAGKGFAVVADEVRNLAGKSAEAAKNTTELIETSIRAIAKGVELAKATAEDMIKVVESSSQTSDVIRQIATATQEQAEAVSQINEGLDQIAKVVQTNSATSEQSAAASHELYNQAVMLKDLIKTFKLYQPE